MLVKTNAFGIIITRGLQKLKQIKILLAPILISTLDYPFFFAIIYDYAFIFVLLPGA